MEKFDYKKDWNKPVIKIGTVTMGLASLTMFLPLIYIMITQNTYPSLENIIKGWTLSFAAWGVFYFVEPVTYYAIIGLSGTYLGFLAGNIGNLRIPCAVTALEVTGVKPGTRAGEIVATLGMTGSVITNIAFTILAALIGTTLLSVLPETVVVAFSNYTVPAIFGAIVGQSAVKQIRVGTFSIAFALLLKLVIKPSSYIEMLISVVGVVIFARILYVNDKKKEAKSEEAS